MLLTDKFRNCFTRYRLSMSVPYLVAVSGGVDSVVLSELCRQNNLDFTIGHCNFGLRGEESQRDENFVRKLGAYYGVKVLVVKFETEAYANKHHCSIQEAARELRYHWFDELVQEHGFSFTLLAHHADDNMETMLMNFFRGTGIQGLTGMPEINRETRILRPLLKAGRKEILAYAEQQNLKWVEDSSNISSKYTRNYFRNELIPAIEKAYPGTRDNLLANIERFSKINELYRQSVQEIKNRICESHNNEIRIPLKKLTQYKGTSLIYELIRDYGFGEGAVPELLKLADAPSGKYMENESWRFIRHGRWIIIAPRISQTGTIIIEKDIEELIFESGRLHIKKKEIGKFHLDTSPTIAQLDAKNITYPLVLRRWKQGDYFYPLGMEKKKKLARFFIDQKLSMNQKENTWVLESGKRIIWIIGRRIDNRFRITTNTRSFIEITFQG